MSSLPDTQLEPKPKKVPGWKQPWDRGRILMIVGCVILLLLSLIQGITHFGLARWVDVVVRVSGWLILAAGFGLRMKMKRDHRMAARDRVETTKGTAK